jgi:hypothetical protein
MRPRNGSSNLGGGGGGGRRDFSIRLTKALSFVTGVCLGVQSGRDVETACEITNIFFSNYVTSFSSQSFEFTVHLSTY